MGWKIFGVSLNPAGHVFEERALGSSLSSERKENYDSIIETRISLN
jgi:hypothetical protein